MGELEQKSTLINELMHGKELAKQLQVHLHVSSSSQETHKMLVQKILASYEKALSMLSLNSLATGGQLLPSGFGIGVSESPPSLDGSHWTEESGRNFKNPEYNDGSRKRKCAQWMQQVQVSPGMALERPLHDGFTWRKYGQKDIHGARYPRGYYRCTNRYVQGCLATKQVQRSDEDPTIFEITYFGRHTCTQATPNTQVAASQLAVKNLEATEKQQKQQQSQELGLNLGSGFGVTTQDLDSHQQSFPSFYFSSTSNTNRVLSTSLVDNNSFTPKFVSPSMSGSNYFSLSPSGMGRNFQNLESGELHEIINSASTTSATNSPATGFNFAFGDVELDPSFMSINNPGYLS